MENNLSQHISQQQSLQLSKVQLQALDLLAAPLGELENILSEELANNPLLEVAAPGRELLAGDPYADAEAANNELDQSEFEGDREEFPLLSELAEEGDYSDYASDVSGNDDTRSLLQKKRDYQFEQLTAGRTLVDMLFEQLDFFTLTPQERRAAELLIGSINEKGFLETHLADIAMTSDISMDTLEKALELVQSFDPPGIGARDVSESLILQLKRRNYPDERIYEFLTLYRDELERNKLPQIAKAMQIDTTLIYQWLEDLKKLNCVPVAGLGNSNINQAILPEMTVIVEDDAVVAVGTEAMRPHLGLVSKYLKMLEDPSLPDDTARYLKDKLAAAENLLKSLDLRQTTISRITDVIVRRQADFFRYGIRYLQPMTMAEVADELDLHETTVSRAVSGKYLASPQGIREYKFFFSSGYKNSGGEDISSRGVKECIRELIAGENPSKPYSDAALVKLLEEKGLNIARRTVAKYRESMNILPTNLRRRH